MRTNESYPLQSLLTVFSKNMTQKNSLKLWLFKVCQFRQIFHRVFLTLATRAKLRKKRPFISTSVILKCVFSTSGRDPLLLMAKSHLKGTKFFGLTTFEKKIFIFRVMSPISSYQWEELFLNRLGFVFRSPSTFLVLGCFEFSDAFVNFFILITFLFDDNNLCYSKIHHLDLQILHFEDQTTIVNVPAETFACARISLQAEAGSFYLTLKILFPRSCKDGRLDCQVSSPSKQILHVGAIAILSYRLISFRGVMLLFII